MSKPTVLITSFNNQPNRSDSYYTQPSRYLVPKWITTYNVTIVINNRIILYLRDIFQKSRTTKHVLFFQKNVLP